MAGFRGKNGWALIVALCLIFGIYIVVQATVQLNTKDEYEWDEAPGAVVQQAPTGLNQV